MNKLIIALIIFLSFLNAVEPDERGYIVKVGDESPDFKMQLIDGKTITKKDLIGKVAVLQFTASWCSVCRKEMPHLEKEVWQKFKVKDFILIGVDRDEPLDVVQEFTKDIKVPKTIETAFKYIPCYGLILSHSAIIFFLFLRL